MERISSIAAVAMLVPGLAAAQSVVRGTVFDSLRTGEPIAGAEIVVLGQGLRGVTDARGRFEIPAPPGRHTLAFYAPWLDSLALPPIQREVEVGTAGDVRVSLATPPKATYQRAACGTPPAADQGALPGEVRGPDGAPVAGVGVATRWTETAIGVGTFGRRLVASVDTSNAAGLYAVCGVPVGSEVALRAIGTDGVGSNEIIVAIAAAVQRRDLGVAPRGLTTRITGRVLRPDGSPLPAATVAVTGDSALRTVADDEGRFVLDDVPRRSTQLVVRSVGHVPALTTVEPLHSQVELDDVRLERVPYELATVTVDGEPMTVGRLEFENRRRTGLGTFISDEQLARVPNRNSNVVASMAPRTRAQPTREGPMLLIRRGNGFCRPRFFLDGYDQGSVTASEEASFMALAKRIEVYDANMAPARYADFDGCGAVVIWTK